LQMPELSFIILSRTDRW